MPTRKAHARWEGSLKEGTGKVDFGNGTFQGAYSFASRFEQGGHQSRGVVGCGPRGLLRDGDGAGLGPGGLHARVCRRDRPRHGHTAGRRLQDHQEPPRLRGQSARHRPGDLRAARRSSQGELPSIAGTRGYRDHARDQARHQMTHGPGGGATSDPRPAHLAAEDFSSGGHVRLL